MFARVTMSRQTAISRARCSVISAGVDVTATAACLAKASRSRGCAQARTTSRLSRSITGAGVPAGAASANQYGTLNFGRPASAKVGTSGKQRIARGARDREAEQCPGLHLREAGGEAADRHVDTAADHFVDRRRDAAEGHVQRLDPGRIEKQLHRHVRRRAGAARAEGQFAGLAFAERDQFGERAHAEAGAHDQERGRVRDAADEGKIAQRIVGQLRIDRRRYRERDIGEDKRVSVRLGARDGLRARRAAGAAAVLDDDRLAKLFGEFGGEEPRRDVGEGAGRERHDDADGAVRPAGLRERRAREEGREPGEQQRAAVNHFSDLILDRLA